MRHITSHLLDVKPIPDTVNELDERKQTTCEGKNTMSFHSCAVGSLTSFPTVYFKPLSFYMQTRSEYVEQKRLKSSLDIDTRQSRANKPRIYTNRPITSEKDNSNRLLHLNALCLLVLCTLADRSDRKRCANKLHFEIPSLRIPQGTQRVPYNVCCSCLKIIQMVNVDSMLSLQAVE